MCLFGHRARSLSNPFTVMRGIFGFWGFVDLAFFVIFDVTLLTNVID